MNHPSMTGIRRRSGTETSTVLAEEFDIEDVLGVLEDADCRAIIEATSDESRSASELSEACDLPLSTTYRKVDQLTEAGLLDEQIRLSRSGQHTNEYVLHVEEINLSIDAECGIELSLSGKSTAENDGSLVAGAD